jgi:hypothetical protein
VGAALTSIDLKRSEVVPPEKLRCFAGLHRPPAERFLKRLLGRKNDLVLDISFNEANGGPLNGEAPNRFPIYDLGNHKYGD